MKRSILPIILLSIFILAVPARADNNLPAASESVGEKITLQQSIDKALSQSTMIQNSAEERNAAEGKATQANSGFLPKIYMEGSYMKQSTLFVPFPPMAGFVLPLTNTPYDTYTAKVGIQQVIYGKDKLYGNAIASWINKEVAGMEYAKAKHDISVMAIKGYFDLLKSTKAVEISKELLSQSQDHLNVSQRLAESGAGTRLSVMAAQLQVANSESNYIRAQNTKAIATKNFDYFINEDLSKVYVPDDAGIEDSIKLSNASATLDEFKALALKNREELQIVQKKIDALNAVKSGYVAENNLLPTISLMGEYSQNSINSSALDKTNWMAGVFAHWDLFDGLRSEGQVQEADAQIHKLEIAKKDMINKVYLEVEQAYMTINSEQERLKSVQSAQQLAQEKMNLESERYKVGLSTDTEVTDAQTLLFQARLQALDAKYDYLFAIALLKRSIGEL